MYKVVIIGAGGVGGVVAHKCSQLPELFSDIVLASRTESKCKRIANNLSRPLRTAEVDADNVSQLVRLLQIEIPALVIKVPAPYQDLALLEACIETCVHYLDTANG